MIRIIAIVVFSVISCPAWGIVSNFEDKTLPPNSFFNGSDSSGGFESNGVHFANSYDTQFQSWSGFAYSNVNDTTTAGFGNQYAAITGGGFGGSGIYGVAYDPGAFGAPVTLTLPYIAAIQGMRVTNTTYAYLAVRDGNDAFLGLRPFGDDPNQAGTGNQGFPDWFKLTITGKDGGGLTTGAVEFFLADYRFANNIDDYVLNTWNSIDLTPLGNVKTLTFSLSSSDLGAFGINTPTYFALDDVTFVPEPQMVMMALAVCMGFARWR